MFDQTLYNPFWQEEKPNSGYSQRRARVSSNGNFESGDYIEVFDRDPESSWIDEGTRHLLYLVGTACVVACIILFLTFLGTVAIFTNPCVKSHFEKNSEDYISLAHDRDNQGCIRDFKHPIGYEK